MRELDQSYHKDAAKRARQAKSRKGRHAKHRKRVKTMVSQQRGQLSETVMLRDHRHGNRAHAEALEAMAAMMDEKSGITDEDG